MILEYQSCQEYRGGYETGVLAAYLRCYNGSLDNPQITPLESPLPLIQNGSCIDTNRVTKLFISGYDRNVTSEESVGFISAYMRKGDINTLYLDWSKEAQKGNYGIILGYLKAVENTDQIGQQLGNALLMLHDAGLDLNKVHIIGHSLGAQVCGKAGKIIRSQGQLLARVTGLDPAGPLFDGLITIKQSIDEDCASFVDIVHSDAGGYGISKSAGTADFWPNYNGIPLLGVQPGCPLGVYPLLSEESVCSHLRSWMYYLETIKDCNCFPAASEPNYAAWILTNGTTDSIAYMGEYVSLQARGSYYLVTNDRPPYGKGSEGISPNSRISKV